MISLRAFLPAHVLLACVDLLHRDAILNRANQRAEITAHAFFLDDSRHVHLHAFGILLYDGRAILGGIVGSDGLVRAVLTENAALVSAGIQDGDRVVTLGVQKLEAGQQVRTLDNN